MRRACCQHQLSFLFYIIFAVFITSLKLYNSLQEWCICLNTKKLFSTWRPSAILSVRKSSRDLYLHVILHLRSQFRINWPIWCRDITKNNFWYMVPVHYLEFEKISIFFVRMEICICEPNLIIWIIRGWDMMIKPFSTWRPSAIENCRFGHMTYICIMILHLLSEFRINRPIWCRDIAKKRFSIWRLSAILNLKNFDSFVKCPSMEWKLCVMTSSYCTRKLYFMFPTLC